jgi:hypothetical protein
MAAESADDREVSRRGFPQASRQYEAVGQLRLEHVQWKEIKPDGRIGLIWWIK